MPNTKRNVITRNYRGKFGDQVVFRTRYGKSIISSPPDTSLNGPTQGQLNARKRFKLAARYARNILQDPDMLIAYSAQARDGITPYVLAVTDYLKPPVIDSINLSGFSGNPGDKIVVDASDDFAITEVFVQIAGPTGNVYDQGPCTLDQKTGLYEFVTTVAVPSLTGVTVTARAIDIPGHAVTCTETL